MKMFVRRTMINYRAATWECIMNNRQKATFVKVQNNGELNFSFTIVLSNEMLDYLNNKEVTIIFDPRKAKERQEELLLFNKRHCEDCGFDLPIEKFYEVKGKPMTSCKDCWNKGYSPEIRRILRKNNHKTHEETTEKKAN